MNRFQYNFNTFMVLKYQKGIYSKNGPSEVGYISSLLNFNQATKWEKRSEDNSWTVKKTGINFI